jgi:predicted branched-subunit amino acid permease
MLTLNRRTRHTAPATTAPDEGAVGAGGGHDARDGFRDGMTVIVAYIPFAVALGAALVSAGVNPFLAWSSSVVVFGGGVQLVTVQLLGAGTGLGVILATTLVMNARHLLYSASLADHVRAWPKGGRALAAYFLADPVFALAVGRFQKPSDADAKWRYFMAMALTCWVGWIVLTATGAVLADALPASLPLELAAPLTFLLLLIPTLTDRAGVAAAVASGACAVPLLHLPMGLGLLAATGVGIAVGAAVGRSRDE